LKGILTVKTADKYKPKNLSEVIYPSDAIKRRIQGYMSGQLDGHLLLWGPNGTGKSTVADMLPTYISNGSPHVETDYRMVLKQNDIDFYIAQECHYASLFSSTSKFFMVFHEFDNAKGNINDLWTALDKYANRVMLIITTNDPMNIHKSLRSRCDDIPFPALTARQVMPRALQILKAEGVNLPDKQVLHYLTEIEHFGDLRKYFAKLDEIILLTKMGGTPPPAPTFILNSNKVKFSVV